MSARGAMIDDPPMESASVLTAEGAMPGRKGATRRGAVLLGVLVLAGLAGTALTSWHRSQDLSPARAVGERARAPFDPETMQVSDPKGLRALTGDEARVLNAARPDADHALPPALPLIVPRADGVNYLRSLDCLTAAIYYESAFEPADGQRAVAQVVLNRVRHPAYPHSVCGVVFQGFERRTGCQFTFSCDGALARVPSPLLWIRARAVAEAAINGFVYKPVSLATHYHANYVVPYWASSLLKISTIGQHIFYRFDGVGASAFNAPYARNEPQLLTRAASGLLVLNGVEAAALPTLTGETRPELRPLSLTGAIISPRADAADPSRAIPAAAQPLARAPERGKTVPATPSSRRWVIGMDGAAEGNDNASAQPAAR